MRDGDKKKNNNAETVIYHARCVRVPVQDHIDLVPFAKVCHPRNVGIPHAMQMMSKLCASTKWWMM